jgi:hypothetical protein
MRKALLTILALSVATPVFAADSPAQHDAQQMADKLNNPETQRAMSGAMGAMIGALLDMRVDGIAKALEPLNGGKSLNMHGRTLRDLAERKDRHFEEKLQGGTSAAVGGMGALAQAMATMLPQLEEAMGKMGDAMDKAERRADDATHRN